MEEVRRIRKEHGLSQQRLAELAGVDKVTIVHIETGKVSPKVETLTKLANALGVEIAEFFPKVQSPLFPPEIKGPDPAVWGPDSERPDPAVTGIPGPGGERIHVTVTEGRGGTQVTITRTRLEDVLRAVEARELTAAEAAKELIGAAA